MAYLPTRTETLGRRIRRIRRSRRISQAELGHPLSRSYVSLIEHDRAMPSLRTLLAIARRLQVAPCDLLETVNSEAAAEYTPAHVGVEGSIPRSA